MVVNFFFTYFGMITFSVADNILVIIDREIKEKNNIDFFDIFY